MGWQDDLQRGTFGVPSKSRCSVIRTGCARAGVFCNWNSCKFTGSSQWKLQVLVRSLALLQQLTSMPVSDFSCYWLLILSWWKKLLYCCFTSCKITLSYLVFIWVECSSSSWCTRVPMYFLLQGEEKECKIVLFHRCKELLTGRERVEGKAGCVCQLCFFCVRRKQAFGKTGKPEWWTRGSVCKMGMLNLVEFPGLSWSLQRDSFYCCCYCLIS